MNPTSLLPAEFEDLAPFVEFWAADTAAKRAHCRDICEPASRQNFYDAVVTRIALALEYLDAKPLTELSDSEQRLMQLVLSFGHVALAIELQGNEETEHARWRPFMQITAAPADR